VRVEPKWSTNASGLRKMGFDSQSGGNS
jgi:hypothetical protein